jgi:hypothetical protein
VLAVVDTMVICVRLSTLTIVVTPPNSPTPAVFINLIPATKPAVDAIPETCVVRLVDAIVPVKVPTVKAVIVILVGLSMLVMVVAPPKTPTPPVFVNVIPGANPTVDVIPTICVVRSVDAIVPLRAAIETPVFSLMFGLGFCPQPNAIYEAYAGASPIRYLATMFLPLLVIII